jgi:ribosomal protein uL22
MANYGYQPKDKDEKGLAYARVDGVDASYRDLCNVCSNVRGRRTDAAIAFLSNSIEEQKPIRTPRHNKRRGHVRSLGGKKGGWPQKSIKIVLKVLKNAQANAQTKGLGDSKIVHIAANKQAVFGRIASKGRRQRSDYETAFVEVVVRELNTEENKTKQKKMAEDKKKKAEAAKKKAEKPVTEKKTDAVKPATEKKVDTTKKPAEKKDTAKPVTEKKTETKSTTEKKETPKKQEAKKEPAKKTEAKKE